MYNRNFLNSLPFSSSFRYYFSYVQGIHGNYYSRSHYKVISVDYPESDPNSYWTFAEEMSEEVKDWPAYKLNAAKLKP